LEKNAKQLFGSKEKMEEAVQIKKQELISLYKQQFIK